MANPLARGIMNNIAKNSGKVYSNNNGYGTGNISSQEESLLKGVLQKNTGSTSTSQSFNKTPSTYTSKGSYGQKVKLEDLAKGGSKTERKEVRRNTNPNSMMTLEDLASKVRKTSNDVEKRVEQKSGAYRQNNTYVRSGVINNLEALIPKVSLNSIGKKGSLR